MTADSDEQKPTAFVGTSPGGVEARVPFAEVALEDVKRVLGERFPNLAAETVKSITEAAAGTAVAPK